MAIPKDISRKKSFILYNDQVEIINELSDKQAGQLFKTLYQYSSSGKVGKITDSGIKIAFIAIKSQIDRDSIKYTQVCEKNKENINKRWKDKHSTVFDRIRPDTKHTDTDNDTDKDRDIKNTRKRKISDDFELTDKLKNYALDKGIFNNEVGEIFEHFKNNHGAKGTVMVDWDKAWYTWVRNEIKFNFSKYQHNQTQKIYEE